MPTNDKQDEITLLDATVKERSRTLGQYNLFRILPGGAESSANPLERDRAALRAQEVHILKTACAFFPWFLIRCAKIA
jgi:hypothetical protein